MNPHSVPLPARHRDPSPDSRSTWARPIALLIALVLTLSAPVVSADEIVAWGKDSNGQISNTPAGTNFTAIAVGDYWGCALAADGSIAAWGDDLNGQVAAAPTAIGFTAIAAGKYHGYALAADGSIVAWGHDGHGQVSNTPAGTGFAAIAAGSYHGYALASDGSIVAWGYDFHGEVSNTPIGTGFTAIAGGGLHGYALAADGSIAAWGHDQYGEVSNAPTAAGFTAISAGTFHNYALAAHGWIEAWGHDGYGQVSNTPLGIGYTAIAAGLYHGYALDADGSIAAWGSNSSGAVSGTPIGGNAFSSIAGGSFWGIALQGLDLITNRSTGRTYLTPQDAIDDAAPGDVILINGGVHPGVVIDKPIYLTGVHSNRPLFRAYLAWELNESEQQPTVRLAGPGAGTVTLSGIDIGGVNSILISKNAPGIQGDGFDELHILHCTVQPPEWIKLNGFGNAVPGISVSLNYVLVEDSTITGGTPAIDLPCCGPGGIFDGGPGIISPGAIGAFDSSITGGSGMDVWLDASDYVPDCSLVVSGFGGTGVSTPGTLYQSNSSITGGDGALVRYFDNSVTPPFSLTCNQQSGPDVTVGNIVILANDINGSGPIVANNDWTLTWYAADGGSILLLSVEPIAPLQLNQGLLFMNPNNMIVLFAPTPGLNSQTYSVGPSAELIGFPVVVQRYTAIEGLSRPVFGTFLQQ